MKTASRIAVLLPLCLMAGCRHKSQATTPAAPPTPVYPPSAVAKDAPAPQLPPSNPPAVKPPEPAEAKQQPPPKPKKPNHHKPKPADTTQTQTAKDATAQATSQQALTGQPPEMSPIGQLSSSGEHSGVPSRQDIKQLIDETGNGLKGVVTKRSLSQDEQLTAQQIRTFLTKAEQALEQGDLDGANTLATKAKVLLSELTKS